MAPTPLSPSPPYGGAKIYVGGLLLMDHSDHQKVKYFGKLLTFNITWAILGESTDPPDPLPPKTPIGWYGGGFSVSDP